MEIATSWDYRLVTVSVLVAVIGAFVALDCVDRMKTSSGSTRRVWFFVGATMMGVAIWMMHFVGMTALNMPMPVTYDGVLMALSMLAAATGSGIAFAIMNRQALLRGHMCAGSIAMGLAISIMHYTGMASMRMAADIRYRPVLFAASIAIAIGVSAIAFRLVFRLKRKDPDIWFRQKVGGAVIMGIAISGMHYTGMASAQYFHAGLASPEIERIQLIGNLKLGSFLIVAGALIGVALLLLSAQTFREKERLLQALSESERNYRFLVDGAKDYALFLLKPNGRIATWNAGAERLYGYRADEVINRHYSFLFMADDVRRGLPDQELRQARARGPFHNEGLRLRKDGSSFWASVSAAAFFGDGGKLMGFSKVVRDITERKQWEARRSAVVETAMDAIVQMDHRGLVVEWNPASEKIFGYRRDEAMGRNMADLIIPRHYRSAHSLGIERYLRTGEGPVMNHLIELHGLRKNGEEFPCELYVTRIPTLSPPVFTGTIRDISARKQAEDEIRQLTEELEQRVRERTRQLEAVNNELEAFSYSVSHDLRAPLRTIDGFSQAILHMYAAQLDDKGRDYLNRIRQGSQDMSRLIDDILELSRLTRGRLDRSDGVNLSEMTEEIAETLRKLDPHRRVKFDIQTGVLANGDRRLLHVVIQNLIDNAWKFTSRHASARIQFGVLRDEDGPPIYYVRDDGAGFDMRYSDKLFKAFQRLHGAKDFPGTGVGLATVARIIHRHGGDVWAEAELEKGATFYFTLQSISEEEKQYVRRSQKTNHLAG